MTKILWTTLLTVALNLPVWGGLYTTTFTYNSGFQNGGIIPDGDANGLADMRTIAGQQTGPYDVNVVINVSGGYNGDLYAYLSHNGVLVPLLNRVGTGIGGPMQAALGYSTAGFDNVTLDDAAVGGSIHNVANPGSMPAVSFTPDGGSLASITGSPNGSWTIFFADMAGGGGTGPSTLMSWSLEVTPVPEPINIALGIFGGGFLVVSVVRSRGVRNCIHRARDAFTVWVNAV